MKREKRRNPLWATIFLCYVAVMIYLLFFRSRTAIDGLPYWEQVRKNCNFIPWYTVRNYWDVLTRPEYYTEKWGSAAEYRFQALVAWINILGNVVMFVPLGAFLPAMWRKLQGVWKTMLTGVLTIIVVEICQVLMLRGRCDIDDVLLNVLGILAGYGLWKIFQPRRKKKKKS